MHNNNLNEPEQADSILRALHVLNNKKHYITKKVERIVDYRKVENPDNGEVYLVPVRTVVEMQVPRYPKTFHKLRSEFLSFCNTRAARRGHRMKSAISQRVEREETMVDKTTVKNRWGMGSKDNNNFGSY